MVTSHNTDYNPHLRKNDCYIMMSSLKNHLVSVSLVECAKILLSQPNIEVDVQNKLGDTALHNAAWKGHVEIVEILLEKG